MKFDGRPTGCFGPQERITEQNVFQVEQWCCYRIQTIRAVYDYSRQRLLAFTKIGDRSGGGFETVEIALI
ncbi:MAG TPA: hypothetical protein EYG63_04200 [Gammaproteobacteria bacterium]|nr:hypothetical protein [Gammaproteobacteria bacterium]